MRLRFQIIVLVAGLCIITPGCSTVNRMFSKSYKAEQAMKKSDKEQSALYQQARKEHWEKQSERSKKMMSDRKKRSKKLNKFKREPWWKKLLGIR